MAKIGAVLCIAVGSLGTVVASVVNNWLTVCMQEGGECEESGSVRTLGLVSECVLIPGKPLNCTRYVDPPAHVKTSRLLMTVSLMLFLAAITCLACTRLTEEGPKNFFTFWTGLLTLIKVSCDLAATMGFLIGTNQNHVLLSIGRGLYIAWFSAALCLYAGAMFTYYSYKSCRRPNEAAKVRE